MHVDNLTQIDVRHKGITSDITGQLDKGHINKQLVSILCVSETVKEPSTSPVQNIYQQPGITRHV